MKALAATAFIALQLSMFACGYTIHIHPNLAPGALAQHQDKTGEQHGGGIDHACQIHATHVFLDAQSLPWAAATAYPENHGPLAILHLTQIPIRIDHPPKHLHG